MKRRILAITVSVLLAVLGTAAVLIYVGQANQRALAGQKPVSVLVATRQIPSGTSARSALASGMLASQKLPAGSVPQDAVRSLGSGQQSLVLSGNLGPGQLLLSPMLVAAAQDTAGLAIPQGMVAVTIQLCMPEDVAGAVKPGSQVTVYDSYASGALTAQYNCDGPHQQQDPSAVYTKIVLPSVQVLSVGQAGADSTSQAGAQTTSDTGTQQSNESTELVTLAVSQVNAQRLIQLTQAGLPYLGLLPG